MNDGEVFVYKLDNGYVYDTSGTNSPSGCLKYYTTPKLFPASFKEKIGVIQYNHDTGQCLGHQSKNLTTGKPINDSNWSSLDVRPGYFSKGVYHK